MIKSGYTAEDLARMGPDELTKKRMLAEALLKEGAAGKRIEHPLQGIDQMAKALIGGLQMRKLDQAGKIQANDARLANSALLDSLFSGGQSQSPSTPPQSMAPASQAQMPSGQPPIPGIQPTNTASADYIRQGLIKRGLPEHIADAFVVNFQDESGLDPGINERNPVVPGSRGGFGLYQLTGPRRTAYENYANNLGVSPDNVDAQLDFLMQEGQGSEKAAFDKIMSSPDTATAAQAIVSDFLRPAQQHRDARMSRYANLPSSQGGAVDAVNAMGAQPGYVDPMVVNVGNQQQPPQAPVQMAQAAPQQRGIVDALMGGGGQPQQMSKDYFPPAPSAPVGGPQRALIERLLGNPQTQELGQRLILEQMQQQQQANDPMRQMEMEKARIELEQLRNPQPGFQTLTDEEEQQIGLDPTGIYQRGKDGKIVPVQKPKEAPGPTGSMKEYEYAQSQGYQGSFTDFQKEMKKAGASSTNVTVGEGDKFYENLDKKNAETFAALSDSGVQARNKLVQIDRLDQLLSQSPQGAEAAIKQTLGDMGIATEGLDSIQATRALLEQMVPQQRPPGSGPMSDADIVMFRNSLPRLINQPGGNAVILNTMRGIAQYEAQMGDIADQVADRAITPSEGRKLIRELKNPLDGFRDLVKGGAENPDAGGVPSGVDPEDWKLLTPEERKLWQN